MKSYRIIPYIFQFNQPSGTSRGVMTQKKSWFIELRFDGQSGWGECSIIENLSPDFSNDYAYHKLIQSYLESWKNDDLDFENLQNHPSIMFGIETAILDLSKGGRQILFETPFTQGKQKIRINGLIWMGSSESMKVQIQKKLELGFRCIKMKIGAIDWVDEMKLLRELRNSFSAKDLEIRVDANGAYGVHEAPKILEHLAKLQVHSIEQPIRAGQWKAMSELCATTPCPIALDEELIGIHNAQDKQNLLDEINPQYIILKPSLHGGISGSQQWISESIKRNIPWWMTSALESNLGLNSIAQLASTYNLHLPQGLGTGSLYKENMPTPLVLSGEWLSFDTAATFDLTFFDRER